MSSDHYLACICCPCGLNCYHTQHTSLILCHLITFCLYPMPTFHVGWTITHPTYILILCHLVTICLYPLPIWIELLPHSTYLPYLVPFDHYLFVSHVDGTVTTPNIHPLSRAIWSPFVCIHFPYGLKCYHTQHTYLISCHLITICLYPLPMWIELLRHSTYIPYLMPIGHHLFVSTCHVDWTVTTPNIHTLSHVSWTPSTTSNIHPLSHVIWSPSVCIYFPCGLNCYHTQHTSHILCHEITIYCYSLFTSHVDYLQAWLIRNKKIKK